MAGPTRRAPLNSAEFIPIALAKSSAATMSGMKACRVGISNDRTTPLRKAKTTTCHGVIQPAMVKIPSPAAGSTERACATTRMRRRSTRSARAPAMGPSTSPGPCQAKVRKPTQVAAWVSRNMSQDIAVSWSHIPISDPACPPKNRR